MLMNFIYEPCQFCGRDGKSLACLKCTESYEKGYLVLQQENVQLEKLCDEEIHGRTTKPAKILCIQTTLIERLQKYKKSIEDYKELKQRVSQRVGCLSIQSKLESEICQSIDNITKLKRAIAHQKWELRNQNLYLKQLQKSSSITRKSIDKSLQKKLKMEHYLEERRKRIQSSEKKQSDMHDELTAQQKKHVSTLTRLIFPIKEVKLLEQSLGVTNELNEDTTVEMLNEAARLSLVDGRWVDHMVGCSEYDQISVAVDEASAPLRGNYSSYIEWLEKNHVGSGTDPPPGGTMTNSTDVVAMYQPTERSVLRIGAALCHAAQMLLVIRKILCVHLPHKINYRTFCNPSISPSKFTSSVKLLNSNVLCLCLEQGVDGNSLHPLYTLRNLQIITEKLIADGERKEPCLPSINVLLSMEQTLGLADMSDDDSDVDLDATDWCLPFEDELSQFIPSEPNPSIPTLSAYTSTNTQTSVLSQPVGLVTSALNWATKGWWGQPGE